MLLHPTSWTDMRYINCANSIVKIDPNKLLHFKPQNQKYYPPTYILIFKNCMLRVKDI